jgi:hypothetical protein
LEKFFGKIFLFERQLLSRFRFGVALKDPLKLYTGATVRHKNTTTQNITVKQCCLIIIHEESRILYNHYCVILITNYMGGVVITKEHVISHYTTLSDSNTKLYGGWYK